MATQWTRIDDPSFVHYADIAQADGWLADALWRSGAEAEAALASRSIDEQIAAVRQSWGALGSALRALNLRAEAVPAYLSGMARAYGSSWRPRATFVVPARPNPGGTISAVAFDVWRGARGGADVPEGTWVVVRASLGPDNGLISRCAESAACVTSGPDGVSRQFEEQRLPGSTTCPSATSWLCGAISAPTFQSVGLLPPLVLSLRLVRELAQAIRDRGGVDTVRDAWRASSSAAAFTVGAAPTYNVPDPMGWTRPMPPAPAPVGDISGGTAIAFSPGSVPVVRRIGAPDVSAMTGSTALGPSGGGSTSPPPSVPPSIGPSGGGSTSPPPSVPPSIVASPADCTHPGCTPPPMPAPPDSFVASSPRRGAPTWVWWGLAAVGIGVVAVTVTRSRTPAARGRKARQR